MQVKVNYPGFGTFAVEDGSRHVLHVTRLKTAVEAHVNVLVEAGVDIGNAEDTNGRLALRYGTEFFGR